MKTILITGCSKGIGKATANYLAHLNYQIIGIARTPPKDKFPGIFYSADLSNGDETQAILDDIKREHQVDGIINNVGNVHPQLLEEVTLSTFYKVMDLNLRPAIQVTQAFLSSMKENHWGRIVNITSRAMLGKIGRTSYSAAKASLAALTRTWALELAHHGITVNAVAPGPIETEAFYKNYPKGSAEEKKIISTIPIGRMGTPQEVAFAVAFFLNDYANFITGQTLFVDGGGSIGAGQRIGSF